MTALSEPERLVHDVLVELDAFATTGHVMPAVFDKRARELVAALRPLLAVDSVSAGRLVQVARAMGMVGPETVPFGSGFEGMVMAARQGREAVEAMEQRPRPAEPEMVTQRQAHALPFGSWVIHCRADHTPYPDAIPVRSDRITPCDGVPSQRVLYRAPAPAPKVGDVVASHDEAIKLPLGSFLTGSNGTRGIVHLDGRDGASIMWADGMSNDYGDAPTWPATIREVGNDS